MKIRTANSTWLIPSATIAAAGLSGLLLLTVFVGCKAPFPGGIPLRPSPLGSVVDEANRIQEENAELAKLIIYAHEFELNKPRKEIDRPWAHSVADDIAEQDGKRTVPRGFRLNEYGVDHLKQIAKFLLTNPEHPVIVQRSETSKHWDTVYHYPVHLNENLDQQRRQVVVAGLESLGIGHADGLVIVAPAYPEGQHSQEAVEGYSSLWSDSSSGGGSQMNSGGGRTR